MSKLIFRIKYDYMEILTNDMKNVYGNMDYKRLDLKNNRDVETLENYLEQEKLIHDLIIFYQTLVTKDANDIKGLVEEIKETDTLQSKKWN